MQSRSPQLRGPRPIPSSRSPLANNFSERFAPPSVPTGPLITPQLDPVVQTKDTPWAATRDLPRNSYDQSSVVQTIEANTANLSNLNLENDSQSDHEDYSLPVLNPVTTESKSITTQARSMDTSPQLRQKNVRRRPVSSVGEPKLSNQFNPLPALNQGHANYNKRSSEDLVFNNESSSNGSRPPWRASFTPSANDELTFTDTGTPSHALNVLNGGKAERIYDYERDGHNPPVPPKTHSPPSSRAFPESSNFKTSYRHSMQLPLPSESQTSSPQFRPMNPEASVNSFSTRRPMSYIENKEKPLPAVSMDWRQAGSYRQDDIPEKKTFREGLESPPPLGEPANGSMATGVPSFSPRMSKESTERPKQWRYHIQKNLKDFYLTTNPDSDHIQCPVGPSYYVDVSLGGSNGYGNLAFSMSLVDPAKQFCEIKITRAFHPNDEEYFDVTVFKKPNARQAEEFDFGSNSNISGFDHQMNEEGTPNFGKNVSSETNGTSMAGPQIAWKSRAVAIKAQTLDDVNSSSKFLGKRPMVRQFILQDDRGRKWIIGNRSEHHSPLYDLEDKEEEEEEDDIEPELNVGVANSKPVKKRSTKVYFFVPGPAGPDTDKIMAVLQRRKQFHKKLMGDLNKMRHMDDKVSEYEYDDTNSKRRGFFKKSHHLNGSHSNTSSMASATHGVPHEYGGSGVVDEEDSAKFGWLTMYDNVKKRPGMWPIVAGLTLAVSYSQRIDAKEKSVAQKFKRLGRKYRDGRMQVLQGHRHTQSSLQ